MAPGKDMRRPDLSESMPSQALKMSDPWGEAELTGGHGPGPSIHQSCPTRSQRRRASGRIFRRRSRRRCRWRPCSRATSSLDGAYPTQDRPLEAEDPVWLTDRQLHKGRRRLLHPELAGRERRGAEDVKHTGLFLRVDVAHGPPPRHLYASLLPAQDRTHWLRYRGPGPEAVGLSVPLSSG